MNWNKWIKAAAVRAVKTVAQAAIASIGTAVALKDVDWRYIISASILAGILSVLTSLAGLPEVDESRDLSAEFLDELSDGRGDDEQ